MSHHTSHLPRSGDASPVIPQRLSDFLSRDRGNQIESMTEIDRSSLTLTAAADDEKHRSSDDDDDSSEVSTDSEEEEERKQEHSLEPSMRQRLAELDIGLGPNDEEQLLALSTKGVANQYASRATPSTSATLSPTFSLPTPGPTPTHPSALALPSSPSPGHLNNLDERAARYEQIRRATEQQEAELAYYARQVSPKPAANIAASSSTTPASPAMSRNVSSGSNHGGAVPASSVASNSVSTGAPSTLSLLHNIQRYHLLNSHLLQSLSHSVQSQSQQLIELEDSLTKSKFLDFMLRLVKDGVAGGGGGGNSGNMPGMSQLFQIYAAFTHTPTATLLNQYSTNSYAVLFDKRRIQVTKPFGYAEEVEYKRLVHVLRARPSLLAFALASYQWNLMRPEANPVLSSHSPLVDPITVATHKRSMDTVAKCVVWDLFGGPGGSASGGAGGSGTGSSSEAKSERQVSYTVRMTLRCMWEKEVEKSRATPGGPNNNSASSAYAAQAGSGSAIPLPMHLLEHSAFLSKLFQEYNLRCGSEFLHRVLKDLLHVVILFDDSMDLNGDLMGMVPTGNGGSMQSPDGVGGALGVAGMDQEMSPLHSPHSTTFQGSNPSAKLFDSFPPPLQPPVGDDCSFAKTPPRTNGRSSDNLYDLCTTLLEKLTQHVDLLPRGMRLLGKDLARMVWQTTHPNVSPNHVPTVAELLPKDPNFEHPSTRLLSDYFFLQWLVQAIMSPESYTRGTGGVSLTEGYPLSSLAKRNLQAISTVLIKLTSGSRFSAFSAAAAQASNNGGSNNGNGQNSPSKLIPISRLDRFLELHQSRVHAWFRQVISVDEFDEGTQVEEGSMEHPILEQLVRVPTAWTGLNDIREPWTDITVPIPEPELNPILLLPNDLFTLHNLLKACWNQAVQMRVASTPSKRRGTATAAGQNGTPPVVPVPIHRLPLPQFPKALMRSCSNSAKVVDPEEFSQPCPYPVDILTLLLSSLANLGDPASFVAPEANVYVLLDSGFVPMKLPVELAELRKQWPWNEPALRHAKDVLLQTLASVPTLQPDASNVSTQAFEDLFDELAVEQSLASNPSLASQIDATHALLATQLPAAWRSDSFRPFLLALQHLLLRQSSILLHSKSVSSRMLLNYGLIQRESDALSRRDVSVLAQFRDLQLKRLLELTRPKIRRLKGHLVRNDPRRAATQLHGQQPNTQQQPSKPVVVHACAGHCPDSAAQDRFLCGMCSPFLEGRGRMLRQFITKYVIGEGVVLINTTTQQHQTHHGGHATINSFSVPDAKQNSAPLHLSVGIGPPLDIRDVHIASEIQDYILSSAYPELFVRCGKADDTFYIRATKLAGFFQRNFAQFYVYMQLMDLMPDGAKAYEVWSSWRKGFMSEPSREDGLGMALTGHEPITIDLPGMNKSKTLRIPYLGTHAASQAYRLLRGLDGHVKAKRKLEVCISVRSLLLTTLGTASATELSSTSAFETLSVEEVSERVAALQPFDAADEDAPSVSFHPLHPSNSAAQQPDEVEAGSVEDYMAALCFMVLLSNPPFFLSNVQFLKTLYPAASSCKAFVDLLVAVKYLDGVWTSLKPIIHAQEAAAEARAQEVRLEKEQRQARARAEKEMAQQAAELSRQIQDMQQQPQQPQSHPPIDPVVQPPPLPVRHHSVGSNSLATSPAGRPTGGIPSRPPSQQSSAAQLLQASQLSAAASLRSRLMAMGFAEENIHDGIRLLSESARSSEERAFMTVLDFATVVGELTDAGFDRAPVVAIIEQLGLTDINAQMVARQLEANGVRRKS